MNSSVIVVVLIATLLLLLVVLALVSILKRLTSRPIQEPTKRGYYSFYSSAYEQTPQELEDDIEAVQFSSQQRTLEDEQFYRLTDNDITAPFLEILPQETKWSLYRTIHNPLLHLTTLTLKLYYNRARPYQLADTDPIVTLSSSSPSYPSGHALQAFALAKRLSRQYPEKAVEINLVAERIANIRKIGGVHYPSDKEFSRRLVDKLFWL